MSARAVILLIVVGLFSTRAQCQQMLVMKGNKIISRFNEGDDIYFGLKDQNQIHHTTLARIREFDFITTSQDTIAMRRVGVLKFRNPDRRKYALSVAAAGVALFGIYLLNENAFGDKNGMSLKGLRFSALYGLGAAAFIFATANSSVKLNGIKRLKGIAADSPLIR